MIEVSEEDIENARELIANGTAEAVLYRILIKPIEATTTMELSEKGQHETLAKAGFIVKSEHQAERETKGTQHGILVHVGPGAFKGQLSEFCPEVPKVGDVIIFDRYTGVEMELPPGSGNKFRFANDETLLGRMVRK
tara:strand:- start:251 stop:661 length:411 start_codon:yes stop_codon:yes gene_type:complete